MIKIIFIVDWTNFKTRSPAGNIYVFETETQWDFYSVIQGSEVMKCSVAKSEKPEENMMFVERNISSKPNIIRCLKVIDSSMEKEIPVEQIAEVEPNNPPKEGEKLPPTQEVDKKINEEEKE